MAGVSLATGARFKPTGLSDLGLGMHPQLLALQLAPRNDGDQGGQQWLHALPEDICESLVMDKS